ncbi:hypothetical protein LUZ61_004185 [Rhynchospora tenuis]|uniref:Epidermal patterning factor-like protein n=1 Tax=Rhynchospora tenuis TaxID=198213 RepID=A0AAD6ETJ9_9POAL|nr:hypothetical protein LUZ61_004185 [Rhynchospora tenuis]
MAMAATNAALLILLFLSSLNSVTCITRFLLLSHKEMEMLLEDKSRLGSTPPSCHNKCNQCNPCFPVQVPAFPAQDNPIHRAKKKRLTNVDLHSFREFSNYKPLGWKCQCHQHLYNP